MVERKEFREGKVSLAEKPRQEAHYDYIAVEPGYWGTGKGPIQLFGPPDIWLYDSICRLFPGPLFSVHQASLAHLLLQDVGWAPLPFYRPVLQQTSGSFPTEPPSSGNSDD